MKMNNQKDTTELFMHIAISLKLIGLQISFIKDVFGDEETEIALHKAIERLSDPDELMNVMSQIL